MKDNKETQGQRIKRFREKAGLTQEDVGKEVGLTKQAVYKYENDIVTNIPYDKVLLLAKALNVQPWDILGWDSPSDKIFKLDEESTFITIPFISQRLSAGTGYEYLSEDNLDVRKIDILASIANGVDKNTLIAAEANGNSMIGEKIYSGDIVVFSRGLIKGEGIYVINYAGDVMVKKIDFDKLNNKVSIISANPDYPTRTVDAEYVSLLGKVIGWFHKENY